MAESSQENALTSADYWQDEFWQVGTHDPPDPHFDPEHPEYRELHRFCKQHLPQDGNVRLLELGCHPGRYLWYFHTFFGYQVEGLEYVPPACELTREALASHNVPAVIHQADMFDFQPEGDLYDIVFSLGLVEHFIDVTPAIECHARLTRPGGLVLIFIPNHAGINGTILKRIQPRVYDVHNHMSFRDLKRAVEAVPELEYIDGGYLGRFGFAPSNLCPHLKQKWHRKAYALFERLYNYSVRFSRILPNTRWLSPSAAIVARRRD
jgi:SAM-dependent methyltransferase